MTFNKKNTTNISRFLKNQLSDESINQFTGMASRLLLNKNLTKGDMEVIQEIEELFNLNFKTRFFTKKFYELIKQKELH